VTDQDENFQLAIRKKKARIEEINLILACNCARPCCR
jgi:hypothetical protein